MWRTLRIALLLVTLFGVGLSAWFDQHRTTSWQHTVWVGVFPINADASAVTTQYLAELRAAELAPISAFVAREARRYGGQLDEPVALRLYPELARAPPALARGAGVFARILWSLSLRHYRSQVLSGIERARPQITLFLVYHDPARTAVVPHSLGLQRGLMGVVHLYATSAQRDQNNVVVAHELLHTFGASDKYGDNNVPRFPDGYAEPALQPRYPQRYAELMAGRTPLTATTQRMPDDLDQVLIGPATAREIGWSARR